MFLFPAGIRFSTGNFKPICKIPQAILWCPLSLRKYMHNIIQLNAATAMARCNVQSYRGYSTVAAKEASQSNDGKVIEHHARILEQFRLQASTFNSSGFATLGLQWIIDNIKPRKHELVLDVACGAGHLARALAPHVTHVSGIDLTPEMLNQAQRLANADGVRNLSLLCGDALALPWLNGQFDLVVCRWTLHQVADAARIVREMVRVTRPGGRIAIFDMVVDDDPTVAAETNRLERLRDPSHNRTLHKTEIVELLRSSGADVASTPMYDRCLDLEDWMERTQTPPKDRSHIRQRMNDELSGGSRTGLRPQRDANGIITFIHPSLLAIATPVACH